MRLLLTGASGLFGANFLLQYGSRYDVVSVVRQHPLAAPWASEMVDLTDAGAVQALVRRVRPAVILHAAAMTNVDACEDHLAAAQALNTAATERLAQLAQECRASLIAVSTDYVFDGRKPGGGYTETDAPHPLGVYAQTKWQGEQAVQRSCPGATIIRTTLYGWNAQPKQSFAERVLEGVTGGRPVTAFTDMYWSPILANDLADAVARVLAQPTPGIFHVAGRERVSRYAFARAVAGAFGGDPDAVRPGRLAEAALKAPRPPDASLAVGTFERTFGHRLPTMAEGLARMRALQAEGWPARLRQVLAAPPA